MESLKEELESLRSSLGEHKTIALKSHKDHQEMKKRCSDQWKCIDSLEALSSRNEEQTKELEELKKKFTLTISANYQMSKLVPYLGAYHHNPDQLTTYKSLATTFSAL